MTEPYRVYPSACGTVQFGQVVTSKDHICLRSKWLKHHGVGRGHFPNIFKIVGGFWEGRTAVDLLSNNLMAIIDGHITIMAEESIRKDIGGVLVSGRADFIKTCTQSGQVLVVECKALTTSARRLKCIRKRKPDDAHVIQLALTMLLAEATIGELRYAYVHANNEGTNLMIPSDTDKGVNTCIIPVELSEGGDVLVDGDVWGSVESIYLYMLKEVEEVPSNKLPERPFIDQADPYSSPCNRCVFASVCDQTDAEEILTGKHLAKEELIAKAQVNVNEKAPFIPKIFFPKKHVKGE